jgi:hypothetical protein
VNYAYEKDFSGEDRKFFVGLGLKAPATDSGSTLPITKRRISRPPDESR